MAVTQKGIVYYSDDPHKRVFRTVIPEFDDSELDQPPTDGLRQYMRDANGNPYTWATFGIDPTRIAVHEKILATDTTPRLAGTPGTSKTEPVIYWVNADAALASLSAAQQATLSTWLAANPIWSNQFVDLGNGDVATLTTGLVSPCWIVVVGGGTPSIGTLARSTTVNGNAIALWTA